jgi:hypothetical protein
MNPQFQIGEFVCVKWSKNQVSVVWLNVHQSYSLFSRFAWVSTLMEVKSSEINFSMELEIYGNSMEIQYPKNIVNYAKKLH